MMSEDSRNELLENLEQLRSKKHNIDCDLEFVDIVMELLIEMTDQELDTAVESAKQAEVDAYLKTLQWSNETSDEVKTLVAGNIRGFAFRETTPQSPINQFISQLAVNFGELKKRLDHSAAENAQLREKLAAAEKLLREAIEPGVFGIQDRSRISAPEDEMIRKLGLQIGFGALMDSASRMWAIVAEQDGHPGSEFVVSACAATQKRWVAQVEELLAIIDGKESPNG